jgi:hypothetical protein
MTPTRFPQSNRRLTPPEGMTAEECGDLEVFTDGAYCLSRWEPTAEDLERILAGGPVWLWAVTGGTQPPVKLATEDPFTP